MPIDEQEAIKQDEKPTSIETNEALTASTESITPANYPSIENDWEQLAAAHPDIYERFANTPNDGALDAAIRQLASFEGKVVLDLGAGTGQSAFGFAQEVYKVLGLESDPALLELDQQIIAEKGFANILPFHGLPNDLPINDEVIDIALAVTVAPWDPDPLIRLGLRKRMVEETLRVLKPGGLFVVVTVPEGAYGGELAPIIYDDPARLPNNSDWDAQLIEDFGCEYTEVESVSDYGTVENAIATYGFIFGQNAIRYLLEHQQHTIAWRYRLLWTRKPAESS